MNITINGETKSIEGVELLDDLLTRLKLNAAYFAVAINEKVIPRSEYTTTKVSDGDQIEVIHAVGGG